MYPNQFLHRNTKVADLDANNITQNLNIKTCFIQFLWFFRLKCWFKGQIQWNLDLRKPDLRKNLDLRKIVATTDFLVHKLFDLRKIFKA